MKVIILIGAPGSGKGTTAEKMHKEAGYTHVSTGDMLRAAVKGKTPVGLQADAYMQKGELVPDDVIIKLVEDLVDSGSEDAALMFDGFPRTTTQADLLDQAMEARGTSVGKVFFLDAPREVLIDRLCGRRICKGCGRSFHVVNIPPKQEGVCDGCEGELYQRPDDNEETISNRLDVYNEQTESLISRYDGQGKLVRVDSSQQADALAAEVLSYLK
jgi:adenylate kinase